MSDVDFIAWSLLIAGIGAGVVGVLSIALKPLWASFNRWDEGRLQRRLDRRLARGSDRYFEELRAIEAAIERHREAPVATPSSFQRTFGLIGMIVFACALGTSIVRDEAQRVLHVAPPAWTILLSSVWIPLLALQCFVMSFGQSVPNRWTSRTLGAAMFVLGAWMFVHDLDKFTGAGT